MKAKTPVSNKKQTIVVKDLKATKNPKGGANNLKLDSRASTPCAPLTSLATVTARWR
jgi:hypothetical protein